MSNTTLSPAVQKIRDDLVARSPCLADLPPEKSACLDTLAKAILWHKTAACAINAGFTDIGGELPNLYANVASACNHLGIDPECAIPSSDRVTL